MTRIRLSVCLLLICCALPLMAQSAASADSVVPGMVKFAGILNDTNGKPLTGTVGLTFLLYKEQSGGTPLWMETQNVQPDKNGHYSVMLGSTTSHGIPADAFAAGEARWLGVQPSGQAEQPRVQLASVPYALKAADAQTLGGLPPSAFLLAPTPSASTASVAGASTAPPQTQAVGTKPVTTAGGTTNVLAKFDANADIANSQIFDNGTNVGIGTGTPKAKLDVKGAGVFRGALTLPATGTATATAGTNSQPLNLAASAFSNIGLALNETFRWQAEPVGNNTNNPSGKLNLLFGSGTNQPAETGLSIANNGLVSFASSQKFPGTGTGNGSVTSVGLSAPNSDFSVSGSPVTSSGTLGLQWLVAPTSDNTPNAIVKRDLSGNFSGAQIFADGVSVGRTLNAKNVDAFTSDDGNGQFFIAALLGEAQARGNAGPTVGVFGESDSDTGQGVFGQAPGFAGIGVLGSAKGSNGIGVRGVNNVSGIGVVGQTLGLSGQGVFGESFGTGVGGNGFGPDGVDGIAHSNLGAGVAAVNTALGDGLFAESNGGFAAFFLGDVDVDGNLSKAAGSFKIDHPLDPANKYLYHSFVESPDMMNIYNGTVITDAQGSATVTMPEWFEALNRDFRYQLTCIGGFAPVYIAQEIANHQFRIGGGAPGMKISWQVTGVRHDVWADAHRIPVEQLKTGQEQGLYLHPELFGASAEKSIAAARHPGVLKLAKEGKIKPTDSTQQ